MFLVLFKYETDAKRALIQCKVSIHQIGYRDMKLNLLQAVTEQHKQVHHTNHAWSLKLDADERE